MISRQSQLNVWHGLCGVCIVDVCVGSFARHLNLVSSIVCAPIQKRVESIAIVVCLHDKFLIIKNKIVRWKTGMQIDDLTKFKWVAETKLPFVCARLCVWICVRISFYVYVYVNVCCNDKFMFPLVSVCEWNNLLFFCQNNHSNNNIIIRERAKKSERERERWEKIVCMWVCMLQLSNQSTD